VRMERQGTRERELDGEDGKRGPSPKGGEGRRREGKRGGRAKEKLFF
jgi:hypothetical protein